MLSFGGWHSFLMKAFFLKLEHTNDFFNLSIICLPCPRYIPFYNPILVLTLNQICTFLSYFCSFHKYKKSYEIML